MLREKELKDARAALYMDYQEELVKYGSARISRPIVDEWVERYAGMPWEWHDIYDGTQEPVGFLILGIWPACHPECDIFIEQSYIAPEHRGRGLMRKAVADAFEAKGILSVCLDVLRLNTPAASFWTRLFADMGWRPAIRADIEHGADNANTLYYENTV